jgi:hypothetical protein
MLSTEENARVNTSKIPIQVIEGLRAPISCTIWYSIYIGKTSRVRMMIVKIEFVSLAMRDGV